MDTAQFEAVDYFKLFFYERLRQMCNGCYIIEIMPSYKRRLATDLETLRQRRPTWNVSGTYNS